MVKNFNTYIMEKFIKILEKSVEKNGSETPLTIGHLLNIVRMVNTMDQISDEINFQNDQEALNYAFQKHYGN